ncbi:MAG: hypothetical protein Q4C86_13525, partial [bacterium]|nr:hypothetical protein [bacterium]
RHAASVRPEPGSNSPFDSQRAYFSLTFLFFKYIHLKACLLQNLRQLTALLAYVAFAFSLFFLSWCLLRAICGKPAGRGRNESKYIIFSSLCQHL